MQAVFRDEQALQSRKGRQSLQPLPSWSQLGLTVQSLRSRRLPTHDSPSRLPSLPEAGLLACQLGRVFTAPCLRPVRCQMDRPLCGGSSFRSSDSRGACSCHVQARAVDRSARTVTTQETFFLGADSKTQRGSDTVANVLSLLSSRTFFVFWRARIKSVLTIVFTHHHHMRAGPHATLFRHGGVLG